MASRQDAASAAIATAIPARQEQIILGNMARDVGVETMSSAASRHVSEDGPVAAGAKVSNVTPGHEARVLTLAEYKEAGLALAEAFKDDHSSKYFTHTPDRAHWSEEQKWELHVKMME